METIRGSITDIESGIIIHQVNCRNRIGAGVSCAIITKWPEVEAAYHKLCESRQPENLFGRRQTVEIRYSPYNTLPGITIVNLFSQMDYDDSAKTGIVYTDSRALIKGILKTCYENPDKDVYIPYRIGCGLAGGNWDEISAWFADVPNLYVVKP